MSVLSLISNCCPSVLVYLVVFISLLGIREDWIKLEKALEEELRGHSTPDINDRVGSFVDLL